MKTARPLVGARRPCCRVGPRCRGAFASKQGAPITVTYISGRIWFRCVWCRGFVFLEKTDSERLDDSSSWYSAEGARCDFMPKRAHPDGSDNTCYADNESAYLTNEVTTKGSARLVMNDLQMSALVHDVRRLRR